MSLWKAFAYSYAYIFHSYRLLGSRAVYSKRTEALSTMTPTYSASTTAPVMRFLYKYRNISARRELGMG